MRIKKLDDFQNMIFNHSGQPRRYLTLSNFISAIWFKNAKNNNCAEYRIFEIESDCNKLISFISPNHKPINRLSSVGWKSLIKNLQQQNYFFVVTVFSFSIELTNARDSMWWNEIQSGFNILRQGQPGSCFFVIGSD